MDYDKLRAEVALTYIQKIYKIEAKAREGKLTPEQRKKLRIEESLPILNEFVKWMVNQLEQGNVLPKSPLAKAIHYSLKRRDQLTAFLHDGMLEPDTNLVENQIRAIALGRKNYLFAGSHDAAQRSAIMYSFFASCKKHDVNPAEWLKYTLENIMTINHKNIRDLYPQNYKKMMEANQ
ncbi:transposase [Galbibacter marinus]|uniref:Transposase n=1 Tax=Galbibacter marinus TaxID=555500 RepID=K2PTZ4_9FLAO|nr:transposase [Galbibacter marinus]